MGKLKKTKVETWRTWKVPYAQDGSVPWVGPKRDDQLYFWSYWGNANKPREEDKIIWRPNEPFKAALRFVEMFDGVRGATHSRFENTETGAKFIMRHQELEECLRKGVLVHGLILGEWRFQRRSRRYFIVPIEFLSTFDLKV